MSNRLCITIVVILILAVLATNLWWLYQAIDQASIEKYHDQMLYERLEAMNAAHAVMPSLAADLSREEVIQRVERALNTSPSDTFEKEGWVVVGWVQLKFDSDGRLVRVGTTFQ